MGDKVSYQEFLKQYEESNAALTELRKSNKGSSNKPPAFVLRMQSWRPSETARWVRLIPFSKEDKFYSFWQLWLKVKGSPRSLLCNCQGGRLRLPCVPCYYAKQASDPKLLPTRRDAVTVLVLENFHNVTMKSKAGKEFKKLVPCGGVNEFNRSACVHCDNGVDKVFGAQYYWNLGFGHKTDLEKQLDEITEQCGNCGEGRISVWGYACEACGEIIASHRDRDIDTDELAVLRNDEVVCPECDHRGKTAWLRQCVKKDGHGDSAGWIPGCDEPTPIEDVWNLEFAIRKTGTGNNTKVEIVEWRHAVDNPEIKNWQMRPMDFPYFLSNMELKDQAFSMGRENPFEDDAQEAINAYFKIPKKSDDSEVEDYEENE